MSEPSQEITFEDYQEYMRWIGKGSRFQQTPEAPINSAAEFERWWAQVSNCEKLRERWIRRLKHRDQHLKDIKRQIASWKRAA